MDITGSTTVFAIAADPIAHVKTPQRLNALLRERAVDAVMVPFHVPADALAGLFNGLRGLANLGGIVVTVPHKEHAAALC
ncbi:MAG: shikimate dehydrogenase family protein, partial [Achromobacter pestifer]